MGKILEVWVTITALKNENGWPVEIVHQRNGILHG